MAAVLKPIMLISGDGTSSGQTDHGIEAAAQSWKMGAPLINSAGSIAEGAADPDNILGIAIANAAAVTAADVMFIQPRVGSRFSITVDDTLSGGNAPGTGSLAQTDCYSVYGLVKDGLTGIWYLDKSDTTNVRVIVMGFIDDPGTINGRVEVEFLLDKTLAIS